MQQCTRKLRAEQVRPSWRLVQPVAVKFATSASLETSLVLPLGAKTETGKSPALEDAATITWCQPLVWSGAQDLSEISPRGSSSEVAR